MLRLAKLIVLLSLLGGVAMAQESAPAPKPLPDDVVPMVSSDPPTDPALKGKKWNRWETPNFTILSLDREQGGYLFENLENIKRWTLNRWGLPNIKFSAECRILCVPDQETMKKLFRISSSQVESREEDGRIKMHVIWLVFDQRPVECIPSAITMICLSELEQKYEFEFPFWVRRGMSILNLSTSQIEAAMREMRSRIQERDKLYFSESMLRMTKERFSKLEPELQLLYDAEAAILCLLVRKEFGQRNFLWLATVPSTEESVRQVLGFSSFKSLDETFKRYLYHLSEDVSLGETPGHYLDIEPVTSQRRK